MDNFTDEELKVFDEGYYKFYDPNLGCQGFSTGLECELNWFRYVCEKLNIDEKNKRTFAEKFVRNGNQVGAFIKANSSKH